MEMVGQFLALFGILLYVVGGIWLLFAAFQEGILWGLGTLCVPFVGLIFVILHWNKGGTPFLVTIGGFLVMLTGSAMSGQLTEEMQRQQQIRAIQ